VLITWARYTARYILTDLIVIMCLLLSHFLDEETELQTVKVTRSSRARVWTLAV